MDTISGTVDEGLDDAATALGDVAARQGYTLDEGESGPGLLVFQKGMSGLRVELTEVSERETELTISSEGAFAIQGWGRGGMAAIRLLQALGAEPVESGD
jgi:hypothetical protein